MEDPEFDVDKLRGMGTLGLMKETVRIMRHNFLLFLSFAASFTIPCSIFTVMLLDAIDIFHDYVLEDFFSKKRTVTPLARHFGLILLVLGPMTWLNTSVCTRGVVSIFRHEELGSSVRNSFRCLWSAVWRVFASESVLYSYVLIFFGTPLLLGVSFGRSPVLYNVIFYLIPIPRMAVLESENYGFRAVRRAADIFNANPLATVGLGFFSVLYFCALKLLLDVSLGESNPCWTKFVVYPALVLLATFMSIFGQVVYTLFCLPSSEVDLGKTDRTPTKAKSSSRDGDVNEPRLGDEVARRASSSGSSQHETV